MISNRTMLPTALMLASASLPPALAGRAATEIISGEPTCAACTIERSRVATIDDRGFPGGALGELAWAYALRDGRFLVASLGALYVTDRTGRIVRRLGRKGAGPEEFEWPLYFMESDSAYLVVDSGKRSRGAELPTRLPGRTREWCDEESVRHDRPRPPRRQPRVPHLGLSAYRRLPAGWPLLRSHR